MRTIEDVASFLISVCKGEEEINSKNMKDIGNVQRKWNCEQWTKFSQLFCKMRDGI